MTELRTYRAATMQEAFELVRDELGSDAVIMHTRQISHRRFLPWKKKTQEVEITAGLGVNIRPQKSRGTADTSSSAAGRRHTAAVSPTPAASPVEATRSSIPSLLPDPPNLLPRLSETSLSGTAASSSPPVFGNISGQLELEQKLDSIQTMLEKIGRAGQMGGKGEIPSELFHLYTEMIDEEIDDDLARELVFRLKQDGSPDQLKDGDATKALLAAMIESEIKCCPPITPDRGKRKVVALVGATGVGKTTTIAKLAANFRLRDGVKMGLVTVDTYRIAAVEQLRTYAEIIDLPMKVVTNPIEMRRALDELVGLDLVLIDTAGRSPRDELKIKELKSLLTEAQVDEVHLVLNLTASLRTIKATAEKFAAAGATSMILTKLDEAAGLGSLLSVSRNVDLPISYLTTGQDVPDDIEPSSPSRIARLVLNQDRIHG